MGAPFQCITAFLKDTTRQGQPGQYIPSWASAGIPPLIWSCRIVVRTAKKSALVGL
jgi:hypothetical protein